MNKKIAKLALILAMTTMAQSAMASDIVVFTTPGYEAAIKTMSAGTTILVNDGTTARIGITGNGGVINWSQLNIPSGKTLDFLFSQRGQVALNMVTGGSMTKIAGTLKSSGQAGRTIISNSSGILMEGSSIVNANSLLLTTHDASWDGNLDGNVTLTKTTGADGNYHGISVLPGAKMKLTDDLAIVSTSVDIQNTFASSAALENLNPDILAGGNIMLATTDGATYVAGNLTVPTANSTDTVASAINIANTSFKTTNGKIYLTAKNGDVTSTRTLYNGDVVVRAKNNVTFKNSSTMKMVNSTLTEVQNNDFNGIYKNIDIDAGGDILLKNLVLMTAYSQRADLKGNNVTIQNFDNKDFIWNYSILGDTHIEAVNDINLIRTQISNSMTAKAGNNLNVEGALLTRLASETATLEGKNITIKNGPLAAPGNGFYPQIKGSFSATATEKITMEHNGPITQAIQLPTATSLVAKEIYINDFGFKSAIMDADKITMIDTRVTNDLTASNFDTFDATRLTVGGNLNLNNGTNLNIASATVGNAMNLTNIGNWVMNDTTVTNDINTSGIGSYSGSNNSANGKAYPLSSDGMNEASRAVTSLAVGSAPNVSPSVPNFTPKGFAAEDPSDHKEQFLRKSVVKPRNNIVTTTSFKAE